MNYEISAIKEIIKKKLSNKNLKKYLIGGIILIAILLFTVVTMNYLITSNTISLPPAIESLFLDGGDDGGDGGDGGGEIATFAPTTAGVTIAIVLAISIIASTLLFILYKRSMVDNIEPLPTIYNGGHQNEKK